MLSDSRVHAGIVGMRWPHEVEENIKLIERHLNPRLTVSTILLTMYDSRTNLANQVVWIVYSLLTQQYGFLVTAILYTVIFANNALKWTRARHQQTEKEHGSITEGSRDP